MIGVDSNAPHATPTLTDEMMARFGDELTTDADQPGESLSLSRKP